MWAAGSGIVSGARVTDNGVEIRYGLSGLFATANEPVSNPNQFNFDLSTEGLLSIRKLLRNISISEAAPVIDAKKDKFEAQILGQTPQKVTFRIKLLGNVHHASLKDIEKGLENVLEALVKRQKFSEFEKRGITPPATNKPPQPEDAQAARMRDKIGNVIISAHRLNPVLETIVVQNEGWRWFVSRSHVEKQLRGYDITIPKDSAAESMFGQLIQLRQELFPPQEVTPQMKK